MGTAITVDGERYGTVCFSSEAARPVPFSADEELFAELISSLLERELERVQHETQLKRQSNLAAVLNRVLRHNLRNDVLVIRGYTQMLAEEVEDDRYSHIVLEQLDDLIELSDKARELDEVVAGDFSRESRDIVELVRTVVATIRQKYPDATLAIDAPSAVTADILPSMGRAIGELLENAAKHSGAMPQVIVAIEEHADTVVIHIADDGPGLDEQETAVLRTGAETPLLHGSGLGLWLAHWIVSSHAGSIDATVSAAGTALTITIPQRAETGINAQRHQITRAQDRYRAVFESASDAMLIVNNDAVILEANPAASTIYGMDRADFLGQRLSRFLPDIDDFESPWTAFRQTDAEVGSVRLVGADNVERGIEYSATTDVVPNQHLLIIRERLSEESIERDGR